MPIASPGCHPCFWPTVDQKFQQFPSWFQLICYSITQNSEKHFTLLGRWLIIKGCKPGTTRWKRCTRQGMGKGHGASMPSRRAPLSPHCHVFTNPEALQTLSFWGFMDTSLYRYDWLKIIGCRWLIQPLAPLPSLAVGVGLKVPTL